MNGIGTDKKTNHQLSLGIPAEKPQLNNRLGFFRFMRKRLGWYLEYLWHLTASFRRFQCNAILLEGKERHTQELLRVFYFGHGENYDFILKRLFSDYSTVAIEKNIHAFSVRKRMRKYTEHVHLLFADLELHYSRMLSRENYLQIPHWIRQQYNVPDSWEGVLQSFRKNTKKTDLRKVRKYKFSYAISTDEKDFKEFYHTMHIPYLKKRFDDLVIIEPEWFFLRQCRKGKLMQILREGEVVAAVLLHMADGRLAYVWVGVPAHIEEDMFNGAFSAMYYFTILYGYLNGCQEIDFLGTRPILNDGLFRYKRKWGTYVQDSPIPRGDILIRPLHLNSPVRSFFANNFFITRDGDDLVGKILFDKRELETDDAENLFDFYYTEGLKCLKIYCSCGFSEKANDWAEGDSGRVRLVDLSKSKKPADTFCR